MKSFKIYFRHPTFPVVMCFQICIFLLVSCPIFGQVLSNKQLTKAHFDQWNSVENRLISPKGNWFCYSTIYDKGADTLYVQSTSTKQKFSIPNGSHWNFGSDSIFAALQPNNELAVLELDSFKKTILPAVKSFIFCDAGKLLITHAEDQTLVIRKANGTVAATITNVYEYVYDGTSNRLVYIRQENLTNTVNYLTLHNLENYNLYSTTESLSSLTLSEYGGGFFVMESGLNFTDTILLYFNIEHIKPIRFDPKKHPDFPVLYGVVRDLSFRISKDGKRVFFGIKKSKDTTFNNKDAVEVWDTNQAVLYPKAKKDDLEFQAQMICWFPAENRFIKVTDVLHSHVQLNGSKSVALVYNPSAYAPVFKREGEVDYYLYNFVDNTRKLLLQQQPSERGLISFSPDGNYICYFKDGNWWLYEISQATHKNITAKFDATWFSNDMKYSSRPQVFGINGWSSDHKSLYLRDEYDVFEFNFEQQLLQRLTNGKEKNIVFSIDSSCFLKRLYNNYNGWESIIVNAKQSIILKSVDQNSKVQFYSLLQKNGSLAMLSSPKLKADVLLLSESGVCVFREQSYTVAPRLVCIRNQKRKILYESNKQQSPYNWGKVTKINYSTEDGKNLNGLLYYPSNYDSTKKYPLIVFIYSEMTRYLHDYMSPSNYNDTGFNIKNFVLKNYFVLAPDIVYDEGFPGISAYNCVEAATKSVIATGLIDSKRIGLTGHSFGGYETNFIVTKSTLFACAVSGAGITDLISWGFTVNSIRNIAELWRSENQQWRMGGSFFEYKERYVMNSPLYYAENVTTPLMTWTGRQELNLPFEQNILFFNALRRAGKKNLMIIYPDEGHTIVRKENKIDLTKRIEDWFDYYLQPK